MGTAKMGGNKMIRVECRQFLTIFFFFTLRTVLVGVINDS